MTNIVEQEWLNLIISSINSRIKNSELNSLLRFYNCSGVDDLLLSTPGNFGYKLTSYEIGTQLSFFANEDNLSSMTVDIDGVGAVPLCDSSGKEFRKGGIKAGWAYTFVYDGTKFLQAGGGGGGSSQTVISQSHTFPLNKLVPLHFDKADQKYILADSANNKPADQVGVASDSASISISKHIRISMPSGDSYKAGDCLYLSPTVPGGVTIVQPDSKLQALGKIEKTDGELVAEICVDTTFNIEEANVGALLKRGPWDGSTGLLPTPSLDNEYWVITNSGGKLTGGGHTIIVGVGDLLICDTEGWNVIPSFKGESYLGYVEGKTNSLMDCLNNLYSNSGGGGGGLSQIEGVGDGAWNLSKDGASMGIGSVAEGRITIAGAHNTSFLFTDYATDGGTSLALHSSYLFDVGNKVAIPCKISNVWTIFRSIITSKDGNNIVIEDALPNLGTYDAIWDDTGKIRIMKDEPNASSGAHSEGYRTIALGSGAHSEGAETQSVSGSAHAEGYNTLAKEFAAHAEGQNTKATGGASHAEGMDTEASGTNSHAAGYRTKATGPQSMSTGQETEALGGQSSAFGLYTKSIGVQSSAFGWYTEAKGPQSFAIGSRTKANGYESFSGGKETIADGDFSVALGYKTHVTGTASFVVGRYNLDHPNIAFAIGNGSNESNRNNLFAIWQEGRLEINGSQLYSGKGDRSFDFAQNSYANGEGATTFGTDNVAGIPSSEIKTFISTTVFTVSSMNAFKVGDSVGIFYDTSGGINSLWAATVTAVDNYNITVDTEFMYGDYDPYDALTFTSNIQYSDDVDYHFILMNLSALNTDKMDNNLVAGNCNLSSGRANMILGRKNIIKGNHGTAFGTRNTIDETDYAFISGAYNLVARTGGFATGSNNQVLGREGFAAGDSNVAGGYQSAVFGANNRSLGYASFVSGDSNYAGQKAHATGERTKSAMPWSPMVMEPDKISPDGSEYVMSGTNITVANGALFGVGCTIMICTYIRDYDRKYFYAWAKVSAISGNTITMDRELASTIVLKPRSDGEIPCVSRDGLPIVFNSTMYLGDIKCSHAEGFATSAIGTAAHAEGIGTHAEFDGSHAEGVGSRSYAKGAHAQGVGTIASAVGQFVGGKFNKPDPNMAVIIGNGTYNNRSNLFSIGLDGKIYVNEQEFVFADDISDLNNKYNDLLARVAALEAASQT